MTCQIDPFLNIIVPIWYNVNMDLGKKLKELRIQNDLTQEQVAKILDLTRTAYARYEKNERNISVQMLIKLADFYDESLDDICGRK